MTDGTDKTSFGFKARSFSGIQVFYDVEILDDHIRSVNRVVEIRVNAAIDAGEERGLPVVNSREIQAVVGFPKIGSTQFIHNLDPSTVEVGYNIVVAHQQALEVLCVLDGVFCEDDIPGFKFEQVVA